MKSNIQIFFENLLLSFLTIGKVLLMSSPFLKFPRISPGDRPCIILGNGPSLNQTISHKTDFFEGNRLLCVNIFARTENYESLKPAFYVITSPEFWKKDEKKGWYEDRFETFEQMVRKTSWDMYLIVPKLARKDTYWKSFISGNPHIKPVYFNNTPIEGFRWLNHMCFNLNLGIPRPHNVLIPSLFLAIKLGFKRIYLAGTDHNWMNDIQVTRNNEVLIAQKHFYDDQFRDKYNKNSPHPRPMYHGSTLEKRRLHEVIIKFYYAFKGYWDLKAYADAKKVDIVNLTTNSYIDAFDKKEIEHL